MSSDQYNIPQNIDVIVHQVVDMMSAISVKSFTVPPETQIGAGAITKVGHILAERGIKKVFIAIDAFLDQMNAAVGMIRSLKINKIEYVCFLQQKGEPDTKLVQEMTEKVRASNCDAVIAFGGGSVIDALKAAIILTANPDISFANISTSNVKARLLPFIAIPTTAGTGSEATNVTVITDEIAGIKHVIAHPSLIPDIAIMDACLTFSVPASVTAATGIDALTHAIEAYVGKNANPLTQALAHRAISLIGKALPIAVGQGQDLKAREDMMLASYMAGIAFSNAGLGLSHATAHRLGPAYNVPHGVANAVMLPSIMRFNLLVCKQAYAEIGLALTGKIIDGSATIDAIEALIAELGLPKNLREVGAGTADFDAFADMALQDICLGTNPRSADKSQIIKIFQHAFER